MAMLDQKIEKLTKSHSKFWMLHNYKTISTSTWLIGVLKMFLQLVLIELSTFGVLAHLKSRSYVKYQWVIKSQVLDGATEVNIWPLVPMKEIPKYGTQTIVSC